MANIDKTDFRWNGKLSWAVNLLYSDLLNVDVVKPPYSWWHRNSSFFLQTRLWYIAEKFLEAYITTHYSKWGKEWTVRDLEIIWDTNCSQEEWTVGMLISNHWWTEKIFIIWRIENWCFVENSFKEPIHDAFSTCKCWDWKLFKTSHPKWDPLPITNGEPESVVWIQVNVLEGWVYRWYFTTQWILDWTDSWTWTVRAWDFITVYQSDNTDWSWFAGQTRMVTWYSSDNKYLVLDTPWNWFAVADENWNTYKRVEWKNVDAMAFRDEWEVFGISDWSFLTLFTWTEYDTRITYQPTNWCIISTTVADGRIFVLYSNGYVRYSRVWWRDKFFFDDEMYAWEDKSSLYAYKDFVLAFGKRNISVWVPTEFNNSIYYTMYSQSNTIWLKSRYSYWEHDGNLILVSNDNRLLALWVAATSWKYMLSFQDIWEEIINWKLAQMLPTDEAFIADYNNELRVLVQTKPNPFKTDSENSETHIYKFDNNFKIWTEDHLENILMNWYRWWIWFWIWGLYFRGLVEESAWWMAYNIVENWRWWEAIDFRENPDLLLPESMTYKPNPVVARVWAFLVENESTGMSWNPDLFNLVKLNKLIVTLGYWSYSDENTKIKITTYREWVWVVTEVKTFQTNDWINLISHSYMDKELPEELVEKKECLFKAIQDSQTWYIQECTSADTKVTDLMKDSPRCEWSKRINFWDHNVCVDSKLYELAPHMPLTINVWNTQSYSSQVKVEIVSKAWDVLNFGWFLAELFIAPIGVKWADWENLIEMSSC